MANTNVQIIFLLSYFVALRYKKKCTIGRSHFFAHQGLAKVWLYSAFLQLTRVYEPEAKEALTYCMRGGKEGGEADQRETRETWMDIERGERKKKERKLVRDW